MAQKFTRERKRVPLSQLKSGRIWTNWVRQSKDGKNIKRPLSKVNDPETWLTFDEAYRNSSYSKNGIGIMFAKNNKGLALCGIDIDAHNVDINPLSREIMDMFSDTYIELSPSGKGYHILFFAELEKLPKTRAEYIKAYKQKNIELDVECYIGGITNRYFTFTGNQTSKSDYVTDKTDTLLKFLEKYMKISSSASSDNQSNQLTFAEKGDFEPIIDMNKNPDDNAGTKVPERKRTDNRQNKRSYDDSQNNTELIKPLLIDYIQEITQASKGTNQYICPFCSSGTGKNATGAFTYYPDTDSYNCFACGEHGDIFTLYSKMNNLSLTSDFPQIVDDLERKFNLPSSRKDYSQSVVKFEDITQQREHIYTDKQGKPIAKKIITKYFDEYTNKRGKTHRAGDKTTLWQRYDTQTQQYITGLNGLKMPLYHLHRLSSAEVIIIAEGEKDVETLERMGYTATSSPNGAGSNWKSDYNKYLIDKSCIVLTDNDQAGEKAGIQTAESLAKSNIPVKLIRATDIYNNIQKKGDISDIAEAVGIEKAIELLQNAITKATDYTPAPLPVLPPKQPEHKQNLPNFFVFSEKKQDYFVHSALCAEYIRENEKYCFTESSDSITQRIYWYSNGVYNNITANRLQAYITDIIAKYDPLKVKMKDVNEIAKNVCADIHRYRNERELNANENIINFQNGILHLDTMKITPHTPDIFSSIQIPCDFKGEQATPVFDKFMNEFTDGDKEKQQLLLEFVGAAISNVYGYRFKGYNGNSLFLVGKGNTGKSVLKKFVESLIGEENCSNGDLQDLENRFGTYNIYNKRLYGNSDTGFMVVKELKIFKQLTGGDSIMVEGKCRDCFNYTFKGFLWFGCNELPKFGGDRGEHVYKRIIPITCNHYIKPEERDANLVDKLVGESSGIIYKAIQALKVAINNGYNFSIPESSKQLLEAYKVQNSPYLSFFKECCIMRQARKFDSVTQKIMNDVMIQWCKDNAGLLNPKISDFKKEVAEYLKLYNPEDLIKKSHGKKYYCFTLTIETKEAYHVFDSIANT